MALQSRLWDQPGSGMKVGVVGLGYVGTVVAGCLAKSGHEVLGVDIQEDKVGRI